MEDTPRLYDTLFSLLGQHSPWKDVRHLHTLSWMLVALIQSKTVSLPAWAPFVKSRAVFAQSVVRRFTRWLRNDRIHVRSLWAPMIRFALRQWEHQTVYLALDTTLLWERFCQIRLSVIYRGRAIPLLWKTLEQKSSSVAFETYKELLDAAANLLPAKAEVVLLADRGFADTHLMAYLTDHLHWHYRIRFKANYLLYRPGHQAIKARRLLPSKGKALFLRNVEITRNRYGPVFVAIARALNAQEPWYIVSDQTVNKTTFAEYGLRFDLEENILDDKSGGFQLESSLFRDVDVLDRLEFVLAAATLFLVSQGVEVVASGKRRWVDAHWFRGSSYLKIGWRWVHRALVRGDSLLQRLNLPPLPDPEPARSSKTLPKRRKRIFAEKHIIFA
jgi:hypothetical protein